MVKQSHANINEGDAMFLGGGHDFFITYGTYRRANVLYAVFCG
jgi:hypothetical protein